MRGLVVAALLSCAVGLDAQESNAVITGRVTDTSGQPVPGVTVEIWGNGPLRYAVTGADGRYEFRAMPGRFTLRTSLVGFATVTRQLVLATPGSATVDFVLKIGCLDDVDYIYSGLDSVLAKTTAIARIELLDTGEPAREVYGDFCQHGRLHRAVVRDVFDGRLPPNISVIFPGSHPVRDGPDFLVFLVQSNGFYTMPLNRAFARPIVDGHVDRVMDLPGASDRMALEPLIELLRARLKSLAPATPDPSR
jgi:hypothetical protein